MSQLLLIRHGQATPFEADTDRLSELGQAQARRVGEALRSEGLGVTHVLHGPLVRQRRSALIAAEASDWPALSEDARLAEYDGDGLLHHLAPLLAELAPEFARLARTFEQEKSGPQRNKHLQAMLEPLTARYLQGDLLHPDLESWADFQARVQASARDLLRLSGATVLAFTSGGVIGSVVAGVLKAPPSTALALNWRVKNASITRLTYGGGRVSLDTFNETGHLPEELRSWR
ncbi:histidine phosphatase family protein [Deinococcus alpinitundrae]|uniref:histidine phosphatase family protein n=1 Tax=Deinococcus alpinitundrae TaxID=468913 RepID=UPI00137B185C|nr:histidine phosphatase family protein [Deinococcus alpinitundrae]